MDEVRNGMMMVESRPVWKRLLPVIVIVCCLALAYAAGLQDFLSLNALAERRDHLQDAVARAPIGSAALFVLLYVACVAVMLPGAAILTVAGGFLFGWAAGGALAITAGTLGATILFSAARRAFGGALKARAGSALDKFADGFRRDAFAYLLALRLTPIVPFTALNIAPAFLGVRLKIFVAATFLGVIPASFVFAFLGSGLGETLERIAAGEALGLSDLITPDIRFALLGLGGLSLLGIVLKSKLRRTEKAAPDHGL